MFQALALTTLLILTLGNIEQIEIVRGARRTASQ